MAALTRWVLTVVYCFSFIHHHGFAGEIKEFYRGARAEAMGNAFVAIADDEQAIFMNPAGLAGNKKYLFNYAMTDITLSSDLVNAFQQGINQFRNLSGDSLNVIIGKNIYTEAQISSSLLMPQLGIAWLTDAQIATFAQNKALPQITMGYQTTNGFQAAYGMSLSRRGHGKNDLRVGIGAKFLSRRGGYNTIPIMTLLTINAAKLNEITGNYGTGFGVDMGTQYIHKLNQRATLMGGLVYTDIGDTHFSTPTAASIKGNLTAGVAFRYAYATFLTTASFDYRHIMDPTDWRKKNHFGLEFDMPFLSLFGGINQVYPTFGAALDVWFMKLSVTSYAEEHGSYAHQNSERRWMMELAMRFKL